MNDDAVLLRSYAEEGSEAAFTALVQRHLDLVYAAALRRVDGNPHLAADIAQQVFTNVARQAGRLARVNVLGAWLHTATRNAATDLMIAEHRRKVREQASLDPALAPDNSRPEWERLRPVLDAAIDELAAPDREAIVLRFLERRAFGEIGDALKVSADAARMRTERALDKLRAALEKRGITSTAAAVGALISSQPLISAPAGLATAITGAAVGAGSAAALASTFASLMKLKTIVAGGVALLALGTGAYVGLIRKSEAPPAAVAERAGSSSTAAAASKENPAARTASEPPRPATPIASTPRAMASPTGATPSEPIPPARIVIQQRSMLNNLRQLHAAAQQYETEYNRPPATAGDLIGPDKFIRQFKAVAGEDYSTLVFGKDRLLTVSTPAGVSATFDPNGVLTTRTDMPPVPAHIVEIMRRIEPSLKGAVAAYQAAHHGEKPPNSEAGARALLTYFPTPQEGADYLEFVEAMKQDGRLPNPQAGNR